MRRLILAVALVVAALLVPSPAQAGQIVCTQPGCGYITYTEYQNISGGQFEVTVQDNCSCKPTWVEYSNNDTYKTAIYDANNSTFYWDIRQIQIGYYWSSGGMWTVDYKGRIGCSAPSCNGGVPGLMVP